MKKRSKIILSITILIFVSVFACATLNTYFGRINTEIEVEQSVTVDNLPVTKPIEHKIKLKSGDSSTFVHTIYNGAKTCNVSINQTTTGLTSGLTLSILHGNNSEVVFPLELKYGSYIKLQFVYDTDINLKARTYNVKTYFYAEEI